MNRSNSAWLAACVALFLSGTVAAAEVDDNIVVIGARTPVRTDQIGSSTSIIGRKQIEQRQAVFVADLLQDVPGFSVSRAGGIGAQTQLRVRGAEANHVQVLIDGVEANDIAAGDEFRFAHLSNFDVERIEVLRGPQSALWGSDALAGVVNIVTRKTRDPLALDVFVDGGSFDTVNLGGRAGAASDRANIGVGLSWLDSEGTNISRTGDEADGYENLTASLRGGLNVIADTLVIDAIVRHTDTTRGFDELDFITGLQTDADRETDARQTYAGLTTRLNLLEDFWRQSLRFAYTDTNDENRTDGAWDSSAAGQKLGIYYQSSVNLGSIIGLEQNVTLAVDHEQEDFEQRGIPGFFGDPNRDDDLHNTGYVIEYLAKPLTQLSVSVALRHDDNSDFDNTTTYRATASYLLGKTGTRLRAAAGTGQKSPTFTERFGFFNNSSSNFVGNPDLKPEKSKSWEVGLDQEIADNARFELTYFNERLEDEIDGFFVIDPLTFAATAVNRSGNSHRRGLEFGGSYQPSDSLSIRAQYTYVDSDQPDDSDMEASEIRRPRNSGSLNLNYAFLNDRANANLNVSYTGDQYDTDFSTFPSTRVELDSYTLVNLAASIQVSETVSVFGRVENLLDENYENVYGFATPGIGAYIGARMQFRR